MSFLEERLNLSPAYGLKVESEYDVTITETEIGNEYRQLHTPYPRVMLDLFFNNRTETVMMDTLQDLYERAGGTFSGFRFQNFLDYSSNGRTGTPAFDDQLCVLSSSGVYQLTKWYGTEGGSTSTRRRILKPESGSVLVGIRDESSNDVQVVASGVSPERWTVDTTTGLITFAANKSYAITNISQASQAVITIGAHTLTANDTVHIGGVSGMTEINGLRGTIQSVGASDITVDINSTGFTAFAAASPLGQVNTRPQANESVVAGFTYDLPVRFLQPIPVSLDNRTENDVAVMNAPVQLIELLNPSNS